MNTEDVHAKVQKQLDQKLPFVIYRKGGENQLQGFLQNNDLLYEIKDYLESGFIFTPFNDSKKALYIPSEKSTYFSFDIPSHDKINSKDDSYEDVNTLEKESYILLVEKAVEAIASKAFKKVVLSRKEEVKNTETNPILLFQRLIKKYTKAFVYLWYHPDVGTWLGATPETLLGVKNRQFYTMALAGTQSYQSNTGVTWADKEIEEQEIVTKFIIKALSPISDNIVSSKTYTHKAGTLLHLRTDIKGDLGSGVSGIENVVKVLHPTPAVCGLPKEVAKSFILQNEGYDRKFYTGFLGELNMPGNKGKESNLFVNLRCMELEQGSVTLYIGGGITKDSDPEKEWEETVRKTATMKNVLF